MFLLNFIGFNTAAAEDYLVINGNKHKQKYFISLKFYTVFKEQME